MCNFTHSDYFYMSSFSSAVNTYVLTKFYVLFFVRHFFFLSLFFCCFRVGVFFFFFGKILCWCSQELFILKFDMNRLSLGLAVLVTVIWLLLSKNSVSMKNARLRIYGKPIFEFGVSVTSNGVHY